MYGQNHVNAKLTDNDVDKVVELLSEKSFTQEQIGMMFGVDRSAISKIKRFVNWKHHTEPFIKEIK